MASAERLNDARRDRLVNLLAWALASAVAGWAALLWLPSTAVDGEFVPMGADAFYHARRILDAWADPGAFYQFDPRMHAPQGGWIAWPWGYDLGAAWLLRAATALAPSADPGLLLALLPVAWIGVNAALLLGVCTLLDLPPAARVAALACFALSPLTQSLHGAGLVDHHYVEYTMVLATLYAGLLSLRRPGRRLAPVAWGLLLGLAPAIHSALFVLQVPVLAWAMIAWLRRAEPQPQVHARLAAGLLAGTALAVAPSQPAWAGQFAFHTLSWFQVYVAGCTALMVLLTTRLRPRPRAALALLALGGLLALPLIGEVLVVQRFMRGGYEALTGLMEMHPLISFSGGGLAWHYLLAMYSALVVLLPVVLAGLAWRVLRSRDGGELLFSLVALLGGVLMLTQFRLHYMGSFALYLPLLLALTALGARFPRRRRLVQALAGVLLAGAYAPSLGQLVRPQRVGMMMYYELTRGVYPPLADACRAAPGTVLADWLDGHFIRFHTECSVIGNMFGLTPEDHEAIGRGQALMRRSAASIRDEEPWIRYVLAVRADNVADPLPAAEVLRANAGLRRELLLSGSSLPPGYQLIGQTLYRRPDGLLTVVARAFRIDRAPGAASRAAR